MGFPMRILISLVAVFLVACGGGGGSSTGGQSSVSSCILKTYSSSYPNNYNGSNTIPTPTQRFANDVMRSIGVKDYYPQDNNNCNTVAEHSRLLYKKTLDRLQANNVDTVEVYQYGPITNFNDNTWTFNESSWQIPKNELIWFIQEAHSRNLKVTMVWQLWPNDSLNNQINVTNPTEAESIRFLRGWNDIMVSLARFSQANNVDNLYIQWSAFSYPVNRYPESSTLEFIKIIDNIRSVFNGKLFMGWPRFYDKRVIEKVDAIVIPLTPSNWSFVDDSNISVSLLKDRYKDAIIGKYLDFSLYSNMLPANIPVIWDFNIQSRDKALSQGWVEDGFCINNCIQNTYVTDFSIQALAVEGAFQAIKEQTYFKTYGINFSTGYWHTDTLSAGAEGFPNLSQSIRGKPSETIVKYWFQK
jgi:hypothetical protein